MISLRELEVKKYEIEKEIKKAKKETYEEYIDLYSKTILENIDSFTERDIKGVFRDFLYQVCEVERDFK